MLSKKFLWSLCMMLLWWSVRGMEKEANNRPEKKTCERDFFLHSDCWMKNAFYGVEKVHKFIYRSQKFIKLSIDTLCQISWNHKKIGPIIRNCHIWNNSASWFDFNLKLAKIWDFWMEHFSTNFNFGIWYEIWIGRYSNTKKIFWETRRKKAWSLIKNLIFFNEMSKN